MKKYKILGYADVLGSDFEINTAPIPHQFAVKRHDFIWNYMKCKA